MLRALALLAGLVALTGCGGAAPCRPSMAPGAIGGGDGAPIAASYVYRWVVLREARADTDGDGRVALEWYEHGHGGELAGDQLGTYLVRESGLGRQIERYVGSSRDGRFVYFVDEGRFVGLDASTWRETPIAPAPAPLPWPVHGALWIGEDAAAVREDGRLVFTSDRARVESWDPATGRLGLVGAHRDRIVRLSALGEWVVTELVSEGDSELPYVELSSIRFACGGLGTCGGPSRTISLVHLDAGARFSLPAGWEATRHDWGWVLEREGSVRVVRPSHDLALSFPEPSCRVSFSASDRPLVVVRCDQGGSYFATPSDRVDSWAVRPLLGAGASLLEALGPKDRSLVRRSGLLEVDGASIRWVTPGSSALLLAGMDEVIWDGEARAWRPAPAPREGCLSPRTAIVFDTYEVMATRCVSGNADGVRLLDVEGHALLRSERPVATCAGPQRVWRWGSAPIFPAPILPWGAPP